jgi:flagellar hook-associated protein 1
MGMSTAMNAALSGLGVMQAQLDVVAQNIANSDSEGYVRRRTSVVQKVSDGSVTGARVATVERQLDRMVQRQLRIETAAASYTDLATRFASELDRLFGSPGSPGALDTVINDFSGALQQLSSDPANPVTRAGVLAEARTVAGTLSGLSQDIQGLREGAESRIGDAVDRANDALRRVAEADRRIMANGSANQTNAALLDERDRAIQDLSRLMDVRVVETPTGRVQLFTTGGLQLHGGDTVQFTFDGGGAMTPSAAYSTNPAERGVGTLRAIGSGGVATDVIAGNLIRSGEIAAAIAMRDTVLPRAQAQLDELAARMASAFSDRDPTVPFTNGTNAGFDIALPDPLAPGQLAMKAGNTLTFDLRTPAGKTRVHVIATDGPAPNPIPAELASESGALIVRYDRAGGFAGLQAAVQGAVGAGFSVTLQPGNVLRVADAGGGNRVEGARAAFSVTGTIGEGAELPLFVDGRTGGVFTGSLDGADPQRLGFSQRLRVNPAIEADPSRLVRMTAQTAEGDRTRPAQLADRMGRATAFSAPGLGDTAAGLRVSIAEAARRIIDVQGADAAEAGRIDEGQKLVLRSLEARFSETAGVSIDQEMGDLVQLQNAYAANARVVSAVKELFDVLLRIGA